MKAQVLTGSKQDISKAVAQIGGEVREVIVFVEEARPSPLNTETDSFAEMEPFTVAVGGADYSRARLLQRP